MITLPETVTLLPEKPSWEVVITTSQNKRDKSRMSIHVGLFDSLWEYEGLKQGSPQCRMTFEVLKQTKRHTSACERIADWLWDILESGTLRKMRFSTSKFMDEDMVPRYENCVDVDVSLVLEQGSYYHLAVLIDKMLGLDRRYNNFLESKENKNGNRKLGI